MLQLKHPFALPFSMMLNLGWYLLWMEVSLVVYECGPGIAAFLWGAKWCITECPPLPCSGDLLCPLCPPLDTVLWTQIQDWTGAHIQSQEMISNNHCSLQITARSLWENHPLWRFYQPILYARPPPFSAGLFWGPPCPFFSPLEWIQTLCPGGCSPDQGKPSLLFSHGEVAPARSVTWLLSVSRGVSPPTSLSALD